MQHTETLQQFLWDRLRRSLLASFGLLIFAFAMYLQMTVTIGLSSWQTLNWGLAQTFPITVGQASILISCCVVAFDLLMREPIGIGTILDTFVVGWGVDFFLWWDPAPHLEGFAAAMAVLLVSIVILCISQTIYMVAGLSCGPRDAMMVALGKRISRVSIGTVSILINLAVLAVGVLLGGPLGVGTLVNMFGTGVIMDAVFRILRFEPRAVKHEGLLETTRAFWDAVHS